jgi:hypothetical protein
MGDKTSYRRMNLKRRDPMAQELADDKYHQRVIPKLRKGYNKPKYDDEWED